MNAFAFFSKQRSRFSETVSHTHRIIGWAFLLMLAGQRLAFGQTDDFNDSNDTGWVRFGLDAAGLPPATYSFPDDSFGGKAYRILVPAPPIPNAGPARAFSYRTNLYDIFYAAVDVVAWDNSLNQAFGFLIRAGNIGLGQTDGYVLNYDPNQGAGGRGQFQINVITGEDPVTLAAANITLDPTRRYRFVTSGAGSTLVGQVYDFSDLTTPLVTISADDVSYPSGVLGLFVFSRVDAADYINPTTGKADVTFDNYYASTSAPAPVGPQGTAHPEPGMPQVANRTPDARANFYAYTNGIGFTATTLTTNTINTSAIRLYLNGADVSSGLAVSGTTSNLDVAFNGLAANTVYDARIVLSDLAGRTSTNEFTFDTFDEGYFDSPAVKVIEAEDYNYGGGQFQDNPPASGLDNLGTQINGGGVGYFDLVASPGIDYFDRSATAGSGATPEYRTTDFVGTQAGSVNEIESDNSRVINDTIRQKYIADNLPEYEVRGTEGGEWLNYTRIFSNASYHVYLRAACRASQSVFLDRVTGDPGQSNQTTARLGVFNMPSTAILVNYRYVPLTDANGNPAMLNLSGTNTVRLTLGGSQTDVTQYTMVLNYLLFAPVVVAQAGLESTAAVSGAFAADNTGSTDTAAHTITLPLSGSARFYRLRSAAPPALSITGIRIVGANAVITYQ